jgi:hypothetical protein
MHRKIIVALLLLSTGYPLSGCWRDRGPAGYDRHDHDYDHHGDRDRHDAHERHDGDWR